MTGGGRGLGRAVAEGLSDAGASVALAARSIEQLQEAASAIRSKGGAVEIFTADVGDESAVVGCVGEVMTKLGPIDILVNAAGTSPYYKRSTDLAIEEWDEVVGVNLRGTFLVCRSVGREMVARRSGSIVNISSVGATTGLPRLAAYCASKAGVEALTKVLAVEWAGDGVRVNAIAPAFFRTEMTSSLLEHEHFGKLLLEHTPIGRFGQPGDLVGAAVFLASDAAGYVTGSVLHVDGGWLAY